jgi:hypothetical protein
VYLHVWDKPAFFQAGLKGEHVSHDVPTLSTARRILEAAH